MKRIFPVAFGVLLLAPLFALAAFQAPVVNGTCGSSHGGTFSKAPSVNLCASGKTGFVSTSNDSYSWACSGNDGGSTAFCSARRGTANASARTIIRSSTPTVRSTPPTPVSQDSGDYPEGEDVSTCTDLQNNLRYRDRDTLKNGEVSLLQDFLQLKGYLNSEPTGFFGLQTLAAVKKYQRSINLAPTGYVGALTRAAIKKATCGGGSISCPVYKRPICSANEDVVESTIGSDGCKGAPLCIPKPNASFSASPTSGPAPLTVSLEAPDDVMTKMEKCAYSFGWFGPSGNGLDVDWGDGKKEPQYSESLRGQSCTSAVRSHTYTAPGTYTVKVTSWYPGPTDAPITDWEGRAVVTVTGEQKKVLFSASPTSGTVPLKVNFSANLELNSYYGLDFGDGAAAPSGPTRTITNSVSHTYLSPGVFTAKLKNESEAVIATAAVTVTDSYSNTGAPVVNGVDGPASLNVGQIGKWKVNASVPNNPGAQLSYSVQWGDDMSIASMAPSQTSALLQTSALFTHIYKYNGTYKPKFTVSNSAGSASAEMMVAVGTPSTTAYEQVKCVFQDATKEQKCYTATESSDLYSGLGCSGIGTCIVDLKGNKGDSIAWKSSCGGYAYTTMDGNNEYANFVCSTVTPPSNNTRLSVTVPAIVAVGSSYTIEWGSLSGPPLAELARMCPTALGEMIAYNSDQSLGVAQTVFRDVPIGILLNGNTTWKVGTLTNDGRQLPSGKYSVAFYVSVPNSGGSTAIAQGNSDVFTLSVAPSNSSITITAPNGGEQLNRDKQMQIDYKISGVKSVSIALYKNDQWKDWLIKDVNTYDSAAGSWSGIPSAILQGLGEGDNAGSIWKIYITGQRADGSGYVDDKSDAPFGFIALTTPAPTLTLTASPSIVTAGQSSTLAWSSTNATSCTAYENGSLAQYNPEKVLFSDSFTQAFHETKTYTFTCTGPGGSVTKSVTVTASVPPANPPTAAAVSSWIPNDFLVGGSASAVCAGGKYIGYSEKYGTWVGAQLCGSADKYKLYMSTTKDGKYDQIADYSGNGQDHCELVNPSFTIPNDDSITSGTCTNCQLGGLVDVQNETVFARSKLGELFVQAIARFWGDLTTDYYVCGVPIGAASASLESAKYLAAVGVFTRDLYRGQEGGDVRALQDVLKKMGYFAGEISGAFYDQTREAVMRFQAAFGVSSTGYVGPATRDALNELAD